ASALLVRGGMLEVTVAGVPGAEREGTFPVPDLDEMPEGVAGLVTVRLMPVVAVGHRYRAEFDGELPPVGEGEEPGAEPAWRAGISLPGEGPGTVAAARRW